MHASRLSGHVVGSAIASPRWLAIVSLVLSMIAKALVGMVD
jgi:hypothetical protein